MRHARTFVTVLGALAASTMMVVSAQPATQRSNGLIQGDNTVPATSPNASGVPQSTDSGDVEFLVKALRRSMAEVQMGQLAERRASPAVQDFAKKLEADHTRTAQKIEQLLGPRNVTTPDEPTSQAAAEHATVLGSLSGAEFDAAFLQLTVASHEEAIEEYGAQTHANPNKALAEFASQTLPTLREHLATAQSLLRR